MALVTSSNPNIRLIDDQSGIYQDIDGSWYLNNGTPLTTYDSTTGAYQEQDGTWYTFQGVALKNYDINTGNYQENDGQWYNKSGNAITVTNAPKKTTSFFTGKNVLYLGAAVILIYLYITKKKK